MSSLQHVSTGKSLWGPLVRTLVIIVIGGAILALSCLAEFGGLTWILNSDDGNMPLLDCPELGLGLQRDYFVDQGGFCQLTVKNWKVEAKAYLDQWGYSGDGYKCLVPYFDLSPKNIEHFPNFAANNPIICRTHFPCSQMKVCANENSEVFDCPRGAEEVHHQPGFDPDKATLYVNLSPEAGFYVKWDNYNEAVFSEYCDSQYSVPVGKIIAVRGFLFAVIFAALIWLIADFVLIFALRPKQPAVANMDLVESKFNETLINHLWRTSSATSAAMVNMTVHRSVSRDEPDLMASYKVSICNDPEKVFVSSHWLTKVWEYHAKKIRVSPSPRWTLYAGCLVFVLLFGFLIGWAYLALSPSDLVNSHSVSDVFLSSYGSIWTASSTWIILPFLFLDELYDITFFMAVSPIVKWGKPSVFRRTVLLQDDAASMSDDLSLVSSDKVLEEDVISQRLIPEGVAAVIVVDEYRLLDEETFVRNVNSVIELFGIEKVFILHFSKSHKPLDDTVSVCHARISEGAQYVYLPERDKLTALYWFSKYYIPVVQLHGNDTEDITHLLIVDQSVELPAGLAIPAEFVQSLDHEKKIGCVCFASSACNTVDSKFEISTAIFLSDRSSLADSEISASSVVLWERDSLELAAFNHLPTTAGMGGDFNGLGGELVRISKSSDNRRIKFVPEQICKYTHVSAAERLITESRKRRLFFQDCVSMISPSSILNWSRLAAKPVIFGRILNALFDVIRLPVFFASLLRDPLGLAAMCFFVIALTYVKVAILVFGVIRLKSDRPNLFSVSSYPFVHCFWTLLVTRPLAVITAFVWAVHDTPGQGIAEREDFDETIPPMLPYPDAPWFTVWKEELLVK